MELGVLVPDNGIPMSYTAELREGGSLDLNSPFLTRIKSKKINTK